MINQETIRKLRQMDLNELVQALELQEMNQETRVMPFDTRLQFATDYLYQESIING